jgi:CRP-like cAMP-binding protein
MAEIDSLRRAPIFSGLSRHQMEVLANHMDEVDFRRGETLIQQGGSNHAFYVIIEGEVQVAIDGSVKATLSKGDCFGEISMEEHIPATATVTATAPLQALVMSHEQYRAARGNDVIADRITKLIRERLAAN